MNSLINDGYIAPEFSLHLPRIQTCLSFFIISQDHLIGRTISRYDVAQNHKIIRNSLTAGKVWAPLVSDRQVLESEDYEHKRRL